MDLRHFLNNNKFNNKLSQDATTLIGEPKINKLATENHLQGVKKSRKSRAARRKKKQKKMMENQSVTLSLIDKYTKRDEDEEICLSRVSTYSRLNDNTLNSSMDYLCEEFAVNGQETSDLNIQVVSEAGPFRISKYPGLDDNTFNPSMNHLCKESKVNNQEASSSNTQTTSEAGPSRTSKCSRLDNTLNPSMDRLCKESEVNETSNSNGPLTSDFFKMAIAPMEYPERKLNSNKISVVKRLVRKHMLSMSMETCARFPCFYSNTEWHGVIIFNCANKETSEWLSNLTPKLTLDDGVQLRVLDIDKLSKYHRAIIYVGDSAITKDLLFFLERQNEGLVTDDWIFFPGNESRDVKNRFVVYFGDTSLEVLKRLEFRPFCGLERAVIKLINKENKKKVNEETGNKDDFSLNKSAVPPLF